MLGEAAFTEPDAPPLARMARSWVVMLEQFEKQRPLLIAFVEAIAQAERSDELRAQMAVHMNESRERVAEMVRDSLGDAPGADARAVASFLVAVNDGFVIQWLLSPEDTPTGEELIAALGAALTAALPPE
jgi:hypothetical protein